MLAQWNVRNDKSLCTRNSACAHSTYSFPLLCQEGKCLRCGRAVGHLTPEWPAEKPLRRVPNVLMAGPWVRSTQLLSHTTRNCIHLLAQQNPVLCLSLIYTVWKELPELTFDRWGIRKVGLDLSINQISCNNFSLLCQLLAYTSLLSHLVIS